MLQQPESDLRCPGISVATIEWFSSCAVTTVTRVWVFLKKSVAIEMSSICRDPQTFVAAELKA